MAPCIQMFSQLRSPAVASAAAILAAVCALALTSSSCSAASVASFNTSPAEQEGRFQQLLQQRKHLRSIPSVTAGYAAGPGLQAVRRNMFRKRSSSASSRGGFLKIAEAPPKLLEARQHGKTVLECSASGNPAPEITWYKDGQPLIKEFPKTILGEGDYGDFSLKSMSETKSRISLDCVSEEDAGLYECVAHSDQQVTSVGTEVHVVSPLDSGLNQADRLDGAAAQDFLLPNSFQSTGCIPRHMMNYDTTRPEIFQWMGTYMEPIGHDGHIICRSEGEHTTQWTGPDGKVITAGNPKYKLLDNGDLIIHDLQFTDMGMFQCLVSNENGEDMKETFVYPHSK